MELFLTLKLDLGSAELFEIEFIICIKMDLALNNLQRLIWHKIDPTNQPLFSIQSFNMTNLLIVCTYFINILYEYLS